MPLVNAADVALYQAKGRGKNQSVVFDETLVPAAKHQQHPNRSAQPYDG